MRQALRGTLKRALTIAGSDSGGCAGIQADIKTFSALGVFGTSVITCVTAQNTREVADVAEVPAANVEKQLSAVFEDIGADAVKIGMLYSEEIIKVVERALNRYAPKNVVLDTVMVAATGGVLLKREALRALEKLFPLARIVTPNVYEAELITGLSVKSYEDRVAACKAIIKKGAQSVIIKGGDLEGEHALDVWHNGKSAYDFTSPRVDTKNIHGTGCTFSSAIAAFLARDCMLDEAVRRAKNYITGAIQAGANMSVGSGAGPVDHFWQDR